MKNFLGFLKKDTAKSPADASEKGATGKAKVPEIHNPYLDARREWNERYGDYISQARNWRYFSFFCVLVSLASVTGVSYIGAQNKIVPYVIQVDKFGAAVAVGPGDKGSVADAKVVKSFLARFIVDWRSVTTDRVAQKEAVTRLYSMLPLGSASHKKMGDFFQESNPFVRLQTITSAIEVTSILPISEKTWQVEWNETNRNLKGEVQSKLRFKASLVTSQTPPTDERQIIMNPLGIFVTDFNIAQQL